MYLDFDNIVRFVLETPDLTTIGASPSNCLLAEYMKHATGDVNACSGYINVHWTDKDGNSRSEKIGPKVHALMLRHDQSDWEPVSREQVLEHIIRTQLEYE